MFPLLIDPFMLIFPTRNRSLTSFQTVACLLASLVMQAIGRMATVEEDIDLILGQDQNLVQDHTKRAEICLVQGSVERSKFQPKMKLEIENDGTEKRIDATTLDTMMKKNGLNS